MNEGALQRPTALPPGGLAAWGWGRVDIDLAPSRSRLATSTGPSIAQRIPHGLFHHPEVGALDLGYPVFELPGESGLWMTTYTSEQGSPTAEQLSLLASWVTSHEDERADEAERRR